MSKRSIRRRKPDEGPEAISNCLQHVAADYHPVWEARHHTIRISDRLSDQGLEINLLNGGPINRGLVIAAWLTVAQIGLGEGKPRLLAIDGFMSKGVFTGLDPEQMNRRFTLANIGTLHFDGNSTGIEEILGLMASFEKMRFGIAEPLEVRGEIPVTLPPNTTGSEAYTTCFYAFNHNGLAVAGSGDSLILIRPETRPEAPRTERKWNPEQILPIRLFRLGYLRSDPILAQYKDKLGTKLGRAILEAKSNTVIVADKAFA